MNIKQLQDLGFEFCAGKIDRRGKNYGVLVKDGPLLYPEGEALVEELMALQPKVKQDESSSRPARKAF